MLLFIVNFPNGDSTIMKNNYNVLHVTKFETKLLHNYFLTVNQIIPKLS